MNLEYLARVVMKSEDGKTVYPDTLVGTDSHTTMINGLGVLGWGVGGIEAEAAMLGQPVSMLIPQVVGGQAARARCPKGRRRRTWCSTVTEMLRKKGVVGKFVEFFGDGLAQLPLADRATIANMAPEYGATCGIFPVDAETLRYLRFSGRDEAQVELVEEYCKEQGLFHAPGRRGDVLGRDAPRPRDDRAQPRRADAPAGPREARRESKSGLPLLAREAARQVAEAERARRRQAEGHGRRRRLVAS